MSTDECWCQTCGITIPMAPRYEDYCDSCKDWWATNQLTGDDD